VTPHESWRVRASFDRLLTPFRTCRTLFSIHRERGVSPPSGLGARGEAVALSIRSGQMSELEKAADDRFVQSCVRHLHEFDPLVASSATPSGLVAASRLGIERAQTYGFETAAHIHLYLEIMVSLGTGFDSDLQYAWLRPYLEDMPGVPTAERARLLHWHTTAFLEETGGDFFTRGPISLTRLHPERMDFLDSETVESLLHKAWADAPKLGLEPPAGPALLLLLLFGFGHHAADDPLHPWISRTISALEPPGQDKTDHLLERTKTYTSVMLEQIERAAG
jgi:hypothetical protein